MDPSDGVGNRTTQTVMVARYMHRWLAPGEGSGNLRRLVALFLGEVSQSIHGQNFHSSSLLSLNTINDTKIFCRKSPI